MLHHIRHGQFQRNRQKHVDMIAGQNTFQDMNTQFVASLDDDFVDPLTHYAMQNLVAVPRRPDDMISMIKSRVRG